MHFSKIAASVAGVAYLSLNDIAPPRDFGWASYGIGWMSYVDTPGHGLWSQLFAVAFFFPCLASWHVYLERMEEQNESNNQTCRFKRLYHHCSCFRTALIACIVLLSNLFYGYMVAASCVGLVLVPCLYPDHSTDVLVKLKRSMKRLCHYILMILFMIALAAYFVWPFMVCVLALYIFLFVQALDFLSWFSHFKDDSTSISQKFVTSMFSVAEPQLYQRRRKTSMEIWFFGQVFVNLLILRDIFNEISSCMYDFVIL